MSPQQDFEPCVLVALALASIEVGGTASAGPGEPGIGAPAEGGDGPAERWRHPCAQRHGALRSFRRSEHPPDASGSDRPVAPGSRRLGSSGNPRADRRRVPGGGLRMRVRPAAGRHHHRPLRNTLVVRTAGIVSSPGRRVGRTGITRRRLTVDVLEDDSQDASRAGALRAPALPCKGCLPSRPASAGRAATRCLQRWQPLAGTPGGRSGANPGSRSGSSVRPLRSTSSSSVHPLSSIGAWLVKPFSHQIGVAAPASPSVILRRTVRDAGARTPRDMLTRASAVGVRRKCTVENALSRHPTAGPISGHPMPSLGVALVRRPDIVPVLGLSKIPGSAIRQCRHEGAGS
jgi:hypothetical protein